MGTLNDKMAVACSSIMLKYNPSLAGALKARMDIQRYSDVYL